MPTIIACPKCRKAVTAPEPADPTAWMRCPLCLGKYQLQTSLEIHPPKLEIIAQPIEAQLSEISTVPSNANPIPPISQPPSTVAFIPDVAVPHVATPEVAAPARMNVPATEAAAPRKQPTVAFTLDPAFPGLPPQGEMVSHRQARKARNPFVDFLKIVVGGLAGLALGYAILFWGFKADPFGLAHYLPAALVPQDLNQPSPP